MSKGNLFLVKLHNSILPNQKIGDKYIFIKWMTHGGPQFQINNTQKKSIPPEIIIMAYHIHKRNKKIKTNTSVASLQIEFQLISILFIDFLISIV
jgi:hypothetical protein